MNTNDTVILGTCALCGCIIESGDDYVRHDGAYICADCEQSGYFECCDCGELHYDDDKAGDYDGYIDGAPLCNDCYDNGDYWTCDDCGKIFGDGDVCIEIQGMYTYVCESCADRNYYQCGDCGRWYDADNMTYYGGNMSICCHCSDEYACCEDCGEVFHIDNGSCDDRGCWHCDYCYNQRHNDNSGLIWGYSEKPDAVFHNVGDDHHGDEYRLYIGVENEISGRNAYINDAAQEIRDIADTDLLYMKDDCSIDNGFEMVSHPCTLDYHMREFPWDEIFHAARTNQFDVEHHSCGLHCHVNRRFFGPDKETQDLHIAKLILVVEKLWDDIAAIARRDSNQYAEKPWVKYERGDDAYSLREKYWGQIYDRYYAINVTNRHTVEFRMFRNTLDYSTFIATLQFVDTICRHVKRMNISDIATVTIGHIIESAPESMTELHAYCGERGVEIHAAPAAAAITEDDISAAITEEIESVSDAYDIEIPERLRNASLYCSPQYREAQRRLLAMTPDALRAFTLQFTAPTGSIAWDQVIFRLVDIVGQEFADSMQRAELAAAV